MTGKETSTPTRSATLDEGKTGIAAAIKRAGSAVFRSIGVLSASQRPLPDFLLIGTKRGGTTSLYYDVLKSPQVLPLFPSSRYLPKANETKGVHFFDSHYDRGMRWYRSYMPTRAARARAERRLGARVIVGEASPYYLFHPLAAERAHAAVPDAKLLLLLRDPVQRTYSHWKERRRNGAERLDFADALEAEDQRLAGEEAKILGDHRYYSYAHEQQSYLSQSYYAQALRRWVELYGTERILVIASEEYYADQQGAVDRVADFLGIARAELVAGERMNAAPGSPMDPELERRLRGLFADDVAELEKVIGRTLPWH